jgi:hypothetical protein
MRILIAAAIVAGLFEAVSVPSVGAPAAVFAAVFLAAALWIYRRPGRPPAAVLGLAFLVELAGEPFYERNTATDWAVQMAFGVLSLVGLGAAIAVIVERRRLREAARVPEVRSSSTSS